MPKLNISLEVSTRMWQPGFRIEGFVDHILYRNRGLQIETDSKGSANHVKAHRPQTQQQSQTTATTATITNTSNSQNDKQLQTTHTTTNRHTHSRLARRQLGPQRRALMSERCHQNASDPSSNLASIYNQHKRPHTHTPPNSPHTPKQLQRHENHLRSLARTDMGTAVHPGKRPCLFL